ncbi:hypothetical protein OWV82_005038 [Melia azedarach]|uniref:Uncharacterized protein n=1 Tax=Melia azedarach TaxID=155640 RepID=A0ACC1YSV2_MELAZ|nr:hypothetical protein OWV82_005038 [Melia azedarach]
MANSAARMLLRNGKSFPQLLRSRPAGRTSNINVCNKDRLLSQSLINPPTQQQQLLYLQRPVLGDGFNFVDFVLGKDRDLHWKSSVAVEARGERRQRSDSDEDDDDNEEYESDEVVDFDDDSDWDDQYDGDTNDNDDYDR